MTCIAVPNAGFVMTPNTGLSEPAREVAAWWWRYRETDHSITRGLEITELLQRIEEVATESKHANWDGEGASAVEASTVTFARMFAAALPAQLPAPEVSADKDGDISFDWDSGPRRVFSISIRRDGVLNYAALFGPSKRYGSDIIFAGIRAEIVQYIKRASGA